MNTYYNGYNATKGGKGQGKLTKKVKNNIYNLWEKGYTITDIHKETNIGYKSISDILHLRYGNILRELKDRTAQQVSKSVRLRVKQFDLEGNFIREFESITKASKVTGCVDTSITASCKHGYQAKGYIFKYANDNTPVDFSRIKTYPVYQYTKDGVFIKKYNNVKEASLNTGIKRNSIRDCICNSQKSAGGFIWKKYRSKE